MTQLNKRGRPPMDPAHRRITRQVRMTDDEIALRCRQQALWDACIWMLGDSVPSSPRWGQFLRLVEIAKVKDYLNEVADKRLEGRQ